MTETPDLIARLRTCAAGLCVADHDEFTAAETAAPDLLGAAADHIDMLLKSMEALRDAHLAEHEAAGRAEDARRRFLEAAVCHPGPPLSETEDYDPDADLSDLEGSVLERMDMETRWHRELMEIRREAEGILARTPDPSRSTVQVFKDLLAHFIAFHQHLEERVTAANEQVASTKRAALDALSDASMGFREVEVRAEIAERDLARWRGWGATWSRYPDGPDDESRAMDCDGLRLAIAEKLIRGPGLLAMLRRRCERYEGWWSLPLAQRHPLGPEFSDGVGSSRPDLAEIEQIVNNALAERYPNGGYHEETMPLVERVRREIGRGLATLGDLNAERNAVAEHIRAAGGDPENATVAQIADAMNATSEGVTFTPNEAGDGLEHAPDQRGLAVKLQWDSPDTFEVAPPKRITIDLRRPAAPPTPEEEAENADYMARMMEGVKQAGALRTGKLADRIIDGIYQAAPRYADKCTSMGTSYEEACEDWARSLASEFSCNFVTARQVVALVGAERARDVLTEAYATNVHPVTVANRVAAKPAP
jgi:hypothetical protein